MKIGNYDLKKNNIYNIIVKSSINHNGILQNEFDIIKTICDYKFGERYEY